jgi:hypothetical protein
MSEDPTNETSIGDELRNLGKSLSDFLRTAWASEERKRVQQDIESSLSELGATINKTANDFSASETGRRMKADIHDFRQRVETGEVQEKARREFLDVLKKVNQELTKAANKWEAASTSSSQSATGEDLGKPPEGENK